MELRYNTADMCTAVLVLVFKNVMVLVMMTTHKLHLKMSDLQMKSRSKVRGQQQSKTFYDKPLRTFSDISVCITILCINMQPWFQQKSVSTLHNRLLSLCLSSLGSVSRNCTSGGWSRTFPPYHVACNVDDDIPEVRVAGARQLGMSDWGMRDKIGSTEVRQKIRNRRRSTGN